MVGKFLSVAGCCALFGIVALVGCGDPAGTDEDLLAKAVGVWSGSYIKLSSNGLTNDTFSMRLSITNTGDYTLFRNVVAFASNNANHDSSTVDGKITVVGSTYEMALQKCVSDLIDCACTKDYGFLPDTIRTVPNGNNWDITITDWLNPIPIRYQATK